MIVQDGRVERLEDFRLALVAFDRLQVLRPDNVVIERPHQHEPNLIPEFVVVDSQIGRQAPGKRDHRQLRLDGGEFAVLVSLDG